MCKLYNDIIGLSYRLIKHCENEGIFFGNTLVYGPILTIN